MEADVNKIKIKFEGNTEEELMTFYNNLFQDDSCSFLENGYFEIDRFSPNPRYSPYDYQTEAVEFCMQKESGLLRLGCGAGKTYIAILAYLQARKENKINGPGIAVVKASLKTQWAKEIEKFSFIKPRVLQTKNELMPYQVSKLKRLKTKKASPEEIQEVENLIEERFMDQFENVDFFITNYEALKNEDIKKALHKIKPQFVLADEIHYIKDYTRARTKALYEFSEAKFRIGSTATPLQKDWNDMYGIFHFLVPSLWKNYSQFINFHGYWSGYGNPTISDKQGIRKKILPYVFIKSDEEISSQLPDLIPPIVLTCDLDPTVQEISDQILTELNETQEKIKQVESTIRSKEEYDTCQELKDLTARNFMLQTFAQELADEPQLLLSSENGKEYFPKKKYVNTKMELLLDKVDTILDSGEKVCIFSYYEQIQDILEANLLKKFPDIKVAKASGKVKGQERYEVIYTQFRDDPDYKILLATDALAEGVNLSSCKYLIEYDLAKSFAIQMQRHGRIRRSDSIHKTVYVYQIIANHSYDEIAQKIVAKKERGHYESQ